MASYTPPTENLPIFDNSVFLSNDTVVTVDYANKHYLKFPNAQGKESLLDIDVAGTANLLGNVNINGGSCIMSTMTVPTITTSYSTTPSTDSSTKVPTTAWVQSAITSSGGGFPYYNYVFNNFTASNIGPSTISFTTGKTDLIDYYITLRMTFNIISPYSTSTPSTTASTFDGYVDIYPYRCRSSIYGAESIVMNINNNLNGNSNYDCIDSVYAPYGRPYWSHGFTYTGSTTGIFLLPYDSSTDNSSGVQFYIYNPTTSGSFTASGSFEVVNKGMVNSAIALTPETITPTKSKSSGFPIS